eukprot:COSAG01_NODE_264_length_19971_cov_62.193923_13_plen_91_part_00
MCTSIGPTESTVEGLQPLECRVAMVCVMLCARPITTSTTENRTTYVDLARILAAISTKFIEAILRVLSLFVILTYQYMYMGVALCDTNSV